jgi:hypothetical protein
MSHQERADLLAAIVQLCQRYPSGDSASSLPLSLAGPIERSGMSKTSNY